MTEVHRPQRTSSVAASGIEITSPCTMDFAMMLSPISIAATISRIAAEATQVTIVRLLILPPSAEPKKRPTNIRIQYRPAITPAAAKPTLGVR